MDTSIKFHVISGNFHDLNKKFEIIELCGKKSQVLWLLQ
jgi:hypothetical protein